MKSGVMDAVRIIVGFSIVPLGAVWILQGVNVLPGSFMTRDLRWALIGAVALVGRGALAFLRSRPEPKPEDKPGPGERRPVRPGLAAVPSCCRTPNRPPTPRGVGIDVCH